MGDVKKTVVQVWRADSEVEQLQSLELAAVMVGGDLGQAVLTALDQVRDDVIGRAV